MRSLLSFSIAPALSSVLGIAWGSARASAKRDDEVRVTGIRGVFFKARDPRKLADWYRRQLGIALEPAGRSDAAPMFHPFALRETSDPGKTGSTVLSIFPSKSDYFNPGQASFMIDYRVSNLDQILAELKADGVAVDDKIDVESNGHFGWAIDPEGNRLELWEPKEK